MKKTKLFGWAFVATMMGASFSACTNDAEEVITQKNEVKLTSEITPSRVTNQELQSTQIVPGQKVGVTITGANAEHKNVAWTAGEDGVLTNTGDAVYYEDGTATITAYHPYASSGGSYFSVKTDQSSNAGYLASDLLWASAESSDKNTPVRLKFSHMLSKINITLTSDDIEDLSNATISICGTNINTRLNTSTGELSASSETIQDIKAGVTTTSAYTVSAIIVPQTITSGTQLIKIAHNNKNFHYFLAADKKFESGYSYYYTLNLKEKDPEIEVKLEMESDNISDWTDFDNGNSNVEDVTEETIIAKSISVSASGTLSTYISEEEKSTITSLKIAGPLNDADIDFIEQMANNEDYDESYIGNLKSLDLKECTIITDGIALNSNTLTSIVLPNGLVGIGLTCEKLKSVNVPETTISLNLPDCRSLETIDLPEGVLYINLKNCKSLKSVTLPERASKINMLYCSSLTSINIPTGINLISGRYSFSEQPEKSINLSGCSSLTNIEIPGSVKRLGIDAFYDCTSLESVSFAGDGLEAIEDDAFNSCTSLANIDLPYSIAAIGTRAFAGCKSLTSISLPLNLASISSETFVGCTNLSSVTFKGTKLKTIPYYTFRNCYSLTSITLPEGITNIGKEAFWGCTSLTSVILPSSITSLSEKVFEGCKAMQEIHCKATTPPTVAENTFLNVPSNCTIFVPQDCSDYYKETSIWNFFDNIKEE